MRKKRKNNNGKKGVLFQQKESKMKMDVGNGEIIINFTVSLTFLGSLSETDANRNTRICLGRCLRIDIGHIGYLV